MGYFFYKLLEDILTQIRYDYYFENKTIIMEKLLEIQDYIRPALFTPRLIKSFGRHLKQNLNNENSHSKNINFFDHILLTLIQTVNPKLYSWISQNRRYLIDEPAKKFIMPEYNHTDSKQNTRRNIKLKETYDKKICNENEYNILQIIFADKSDSDIKDIPDIYFNKYTINDINYISTENRITTNTFFVTIFSI